MPPEPGELSNSETTTLDAVLARRRSPQRRALQLAAVVVVCAVLAGLALHQSLAVRLSTSTTPNPPAANRLVRIASDTTWGTLLLNGKALEGPPLQSVLLPSGSDTLTLRSAPFVAETCAIIAPTDAKGGVPVVVRGPCAASPLTVRESGADIPRAQITFLVGGGDLPVVARGDAQRVLAGALDALRLHATVPSGDYFAAGIDAEGRDISVRAAARLAALLDVSLDPAARDATCGPLDCGIPFVEPPADNAQVWSLQISLGLRWRFFDAAGALAGEADYAVPGPVQTYLAYAGGTWQLAEADGGTAGALDIAPTSLCLAGSDELGNIGRTLLSVRSVRGSVAQGCLIQMQSQSGTLEGLYLWRFGALLAVDAQAHKLLPALPIAPPAEVAAAATTQSGSGLGSSR